MPDNDQLTIRARARWDPARIDEILRSVSSALIPNPDPAEGATAPSALPGGEEEYKLMRAGWHGSEAMGKMMDLLQQEVLMEMLEAREREGGAGGEEGEGEEERRGGRVQVVSLPAVMARASTIGWCCGVLVMQAILEGERMEEFFNERL